MPRVARSVRRSAPALTAAAWAESARAARRSARWARRPSERRSRPASPARAPRRLPPRRPGERGEIDLRGEVGLAGGGQGIGETVPGHRLERVGGAAVEVAVIDGEGAPRPRGRAGRRAAGERSRATAGRVRIAPVRPSAAISGVGSGLKPKARASSGPRPIRRSHQPRAVRWYWRTGRASKNSLASAIIGPPGRVSIPSCQVGAAPVSARAWAARSTGLVSTRCRSAAARQSGAAARRARRASAISVPRPGPSSTRRNASGRPRPCQTSAVQRPRSSPKIWLISGAVVKSRPRRGDRGCGNSRGPDGRGRAPCSARRRSAPRGRSGGATRRGAAFRSRGCRLGRPGLGGIGASRARGRVSPRRARTMRSPHDQHRHAEQHPHGDAAPNASTWVPNRKPKLRIGLAERTRRWCGRWRSRRRTGPRAARAGESRRGGPRSPSGRTDQPLGDGLVELARMARQRAAVRKERWR